MGVKKGMKTYLKLVNPSQDSNKPLTFDVKGNNLVLSSNESAEFKFDEIISEKSEDSVAFDKLARPMIESNLLKGKDSVLLCVGQSRYFKSMHLVDQTLSYLFQQLNDDVSTNYSRWNQLIGHLLPDSSTNGDDKSQTAVTLSAFDIVNGKIHDLFAKRNLMGRSPSIALISNPKDNKLKLYGISRVMCGSAESILQKLNKLPRNRNPSSPHFISVNIMHLSEDSNHKKSVIASTKFTIADVPPFDSHSELHMTQLGRCLELIASNQFNKSLLRTNSLTRIIFHDYVRFGTQLTTVLLASKNDDKRLLMHTLRYMNPIDYHHMKQKIHDEAYYKESVPSKKVKSVRNPAVFARVSSYIRPKSVRSIHSSSVGRHRTESEWLRLVSSLKVNNNKLELTLSQLKKDQQEASDKIKQDMETQNKIELDEVKESDKKRMEDTVGKYEEQLSKLKNDLSSKESSIESIQNQLHDSQSKLSESEEGKKESQSEIKQLHGELSDLQFHIKEIKADYESKLDEIKESNGKQLKEIDSLKDIEIENVKAINTKKVSELNSKIAKLQDEVRELKDKVIESSSKHSSKMKTEASRYNALLKEFKNYKKEIENEKKKQDEEYSQKMIRLQKKMKSIRNDAASTTLSGTDSSITGSPLKHPSLFDDLSSLATSGEGSVKSSPMKKAIIPRPASRTGSKKRSRSSSPRKRRARSVSPRKKAPIRGRKPLLLAKNSDLNAMKLSESPLMEKRRSLSPSGRTKIKLRRVELDDDGDCSA